MAKDLIQICLVISTTPVGDGEELARTLVEEGLAPCVNILPANSFFRWEGKSEEQKEVLLIKTSSEKLPELTEGIKKLHRYEVPEIIALPILGGNESYLSWVMENTKG